MINRLVEKINLNENDKNFTERFLNDKTIKKYLFGRNIYANKIIEQIEVDGFIDDFYKEDEYLNKKVLKLDNIEKGSFVLVLSGGNVKSALERVQKYDLKCLDYYTFSKYANIELTEIYMNENFNMQYDKNHKKFERIYSLLADEESKRQYFNVINFRYSYDKKYLKNFENLELYQYFEDFLDLGKDEVFLDVGGYDGYTSEEFIKKCPNYKKIYIFEPENDNLVKAKERLAKFKNINYYELGLSNKKETLKFDISGSASKISDEGRVIIKVDKLDDLNINEFTFLKMDIEGAEEVALEGAKESIKKNHPKLAISVYHKANDFWKIPELIFNIRDDYKIYLRHYTESIYETVMFFIPIKKGF